MSIGLDTAAAVTPTAAEDAARLGYSFICRYYSSSSPHKVLSGAEAKMLLSNKLNIVPVFQNSNDAPEDFSAQTGAKHGEAALAYAEEVGQKPGTAIYFAVDFDLSPGAANWQAHLESVVDYFRAVNKALGGKYKVGVYGSGFVCVVIRAMGLAAYSWLAAATGWTGSKYYANWNIKQGAGVTVGNVGFDADEAQTDYGGWGS